MQTVQNMKSMTIASEKGERDRKSEKRERETYKKKRKKNPPLVKLVSKLFFF